MLIQPHHFLFLLLRVVSAMMGDIINQPEGLSYQIICDPNPLQLRSWRDASNWPPAHLNTLWNISPAAYPSLPYVCSLYSPIVPNMGCTCARPGLSKTVDCALFPGSWVLRHSPMIYWCQSFCYCLEDIYVDPLDDNEPPFQVPKDDYILDRNEVYGPAGFRPSNSEHARENRMSVREGGDLDTARDPRPRTRKSRATAFQGLGAIGRLARLSSPLDKR